MEKDEGGKRIIERERERLGKKTTNVDVGENAGSSHIQEEPCDGPVADAVGEKSPEVDKFYDGRVAPEVLNSEDQHYHHSCN